MLPEVTPEVKSFTSPPLFELPPAPPKHEAQYSDELLPVFVRLLTRLRPRRVLDPFAGLGLKLDSIRHHAPGAEFFGIEIEPEWASVTPWVQQGDATALPFSDAFFDCAISSPTYGNRFNDNYAAKDSSIRHFYRYWLRRPLHPHNTGGYKSDLASQMYQRLHEKAWQELRRVLQPGGHFILNIKDAINGGEWRGVPQWHVKTLTGLGFTLVDTAPVKCSGHRHGAHHNRRAEHEFVFLFRRGGAA